MTTAPSEREPGSDRPAPATGRTTARPHHALGIGKRVWLDVVLVALLAGYGGVLRLDALVSRYGPLEHPPWAAALQRLATGPFDALVPSSLVWEHVPDPYTGGDPIAYLRFAREMDHFYAAHVREPVFLLVTRVFLGLLDQQDVAVSFASALFSVLGVVATYFFGTYAFSRRVGLGSALAVAIERDFISWGVDGWRDDAFTFFAVLSAHALLRCQRQPSPANAVVAGVVGGLACLTRITSLSFLLPGFALLAFTACGHGVKRGLVPVGISVLVMTAVVAPYLFNCWVAYGDPLISINYHTRFYQAREGAEPDSTVSAIGYVGSKMRHRPFGTLDTVLVGLTTYPFLNKWVGFDPWLPGLGRVLSLLALAGLLLWCWSATGRLLLLVLVTSLLPYVFTWNIPGGSEWRFTQHAYPFFLIASFFALEQGMRWLNRTRTARTWPHPERYVIRRLAVACFMAGAIWAALVGLPYLTAREAILAGDSFTIDAASRNGIFFGTGWGEPIGAGNVITRTATACTAVLWLPLAARDDYSLTLRLDPDPPEVLPRNVRLSVNGMPLSTFELGWNPARVGSYEVSLPRSRVGGFASRLELTPESPACAAASAGDGSDSSVAARGGFKVWYVRVRPVSIAPAGPGSTARRDPRSDRVQWARTEPGPPATGRAGLLEGRPPAFAALRRGRPCRPGSRGVRESDVSRGSRGGGSGEAQVRRIAHRR